MGGSRPGRGWSPFEGKSFRCQDQGVVRAVEQQQQQNNKNNKPGVVVQPPASPAHRDLHTSFREPPHSDHKLQFLSRRAKNFVVCVGFHYACNAQHHDEKNVAVARLSLLLFFESFDHAQHTQFQNKIRRFLAGGVGF